MSGQVAAAATVGPPPGVRVRLSSNESPFGPSPHALEAIRTVAAEAHRYPDDQSLALRGALARHDGVPTEEVAVGTGSAGLLMDIVAHECARHETPGTVLAFQHGFVVYRLAARNAGATYLEAPTGGPARPGHDGYARDVGALLELVDDATRVVAIDNPGNPTGAHLTGDELEELLAQIPDHVTVVVDEAYHDFAVGHAGYATTRDLDLDHPRVLTTRTFSKAHGLAGLRIGHLIGPADLVASLDAWRVRFNLTATAQAAALASLADTGHLERTVQSTIEGRNRMAEGLRGLGVPFTDGLGNFLTVELGTSSAEVVEAFGRREVGVRPLAPYAMDEQIRVSVGTPEEVETFLEVAAEVLAGVPSRE